MARSRSTPLPKSTVSPSRQFFLQLLPLRPESRNTRYRRYRIEARARRERERQQGQGPNYVTAAERPLSPEMLDYAANFWERDRQQDDDLSDISCGDYGSPDEDSPAPTKKPPVKEVKKLGGFKFNPNAAAFVPSTPVKAKKPIILSPIKSFKELCEVVKDEELPEMPTINSKSDRKDKTKVDFENVKKRILPKFSTAPFPAKTKPKKEKPEAKLKKKKPEAKPKEEKSEPKQEENKSEAKSQKEQPELSGEEEVKNEERTEAPPAKAKKTRRRRRKKKKPNQEGDNSKVAQDDTT